MTHEDEDEVRRLLAAAGGPPPVTPPEVADRLDEVLADLVADRSVEADEVAAVELAERRSRRWPKVLVAAATVSVLGLAIGNLLGDDGVTTSENAASGGDSAAEMGPETADQAGPGGRSLRSPDGVTGTPGRRLVLRLHTESLTADVQRVADFSLDTAAMAEIRPGDAPACEIPVAKRGDDVLLVRLDGERSVLVLRAPDDGRRRAEVFACDDPDAPVAETTVDAR